MDRNKSHPCPAFPTGPRPLPCVEGQEITHLLSLLCHVPFLLAKGEWELGAPNEAFVVSEER